MILRLRHRIFGHGLDGHHFQGYHLTCIYVLCRCGESLELRLKNFFAFNTTSEADEVPEGELVSAREAGELNRHGTG